MRQVHTTLPHTMREELEELNTYHLILQEQGLLSDSVYFNVEIEDSQHCQLSYPNDCNRFIGFRENAI